MSERIQCHPKLPFKFADPRTSGGQIRSPLGSTFGDSAHVLTVGDGLKVRGVDTRLDFAGVIQVQTLGHRSGRQFKGEPVGKVVLAAAVEHAIAPSVVSADPQPAVVGLGDESPEPFLQCETTSCLDKRWIAMVPPTLPVLVAPATGSNRSTASIDGARLSHSPILRDRESR